MEGLQRTLTWTILTPTCSFILPAFNALKITKIGQIFPIFKLETNIQIRGNSAKSVVISSKISFFLLLPLHGRIGQSKQKVVRLIYITFYRRRGVPIKIQRFCLRDFRFVSETLIQDEDGRSTYFAFDQIRHNSREFPSKFMVYQAIKYDAFSTLILMGPIF